MRIRSLSQFESKSRARSDQGSNDFDTNKLHVGSAGLLFANSALEWPPHFSGNQGAVTSARTQSAQREGEGFPL